MVNNQFLTSTLAELVSRLAISNESVIELFYLFALEKPKPKHTSPQDEWVSCISSLRHFVNEKAKSYVVGLMNGDLKVYDSKHAEVLKIEKLHQENVNCALYFKSDSLQGNYLVTGSECPGASLVFSSVSQDRKQLVVEGRAQSGLMEENQGVSCLGQNPLELEMICSANGQSGDINLWKCDPNSW